MAQVEVVVGLIVSVAGIARAVAAVGGALVIQVSWVLAWFAGLGTGSMKDAAGLVICFNTNAPIQTWILYEHVDWRLVWFVSIPWISFDMLGTLLLISQDTSPWLKRSFGLALVLIICFELSAKGKPLPKMRSKPHAIILGQGVAPLSVEDVKDVEAETDNLDNHFELSSTCKLSLTDSCRQSEAAVFDMQTKRSILWALFLGVCGGLLNGVFSVPLPAYFIFVFYSGIEKDKWRASQVALQMLALPPKAYYFFFVKQQFDDSMKLVYIVAVICAAASLPVGNRIAAYVSQAVFKRIVFGITVAGACTMCLAGTSWAPWCGIAAFLLWMIQELRTATLHNTCIEHTSLANAEGGQCDVFHDEQNVIGEFPREEDMRSN
eukprot:TRINITY_DN57134_c0_g1_i1.p1 TRINITY_DN57134_c0_g1~~TRINITY_DN57134_c0_g1_i1.p1  ORF type:complete len:378 (-),score=41.80 TRINITY_DN57134_c0_g1_i1:144-1277(-)